MDVRTLVLHVERLVLNGFAPEDRIALTSSLCRELVGTLSEPAAASRIGLRSDSTRVDLGVLSIPRDLKPEDVGAWMARAVTRGLSQ
jgi:hypothetical protein